jgi:CxxC-x17-CxxC domain-containing protein
MGNFRNDRRGGGFGGGNRRFDRDGGDDRPRGRFGGGRDRDFNRGPPRMFNVVCANCGERCQVPFKPDGSKPVLCSNCFRNKSSDSGSRQNNSPVSGGISADQFKQLNIKLDKIINILSQLELDTEELEEEEGVVIDEEDEDEEDSENADSVDEEELGDEEFDAPKSDDKEIAEEDFDISKDK